MTQAPTPGPLSVGDRVVAVADLRKHPDGPVWVKKGEEVGIVREYGVDNCIAGVALQDGREGDWAKSCFRLAPTAPVEASGSEREIMDMIVADLGLKASGMSSSAGRLAKKIVQHLRPQPSGETREAVARIVASEFLRQDYEPDAKPEDVKFSDGLSWLYVDQGSVDFGEIADRVIAYFDARPLALGGQHSTATDFPPDDVLACISDTTPARAEVQDEGAAGEPVAWRWRNRPDGVWNYQEDRQRIENVEQQPLYAHPSPTPAADADRVRETVAQVIRQSGIDRGWAGPKDADTLADRILAALKSEGK